MRFPEAIGFPLPPVPDAHGRLTWPTVTTSVRERLRCLLLTSPGELIGHRQLGVGLKSFLGRSDTLATRRAIHDRIVDQLGRHEPRIAVDRVEVFGQGGPSPGDGPDPTPPPGRLRIEIHYRLRRTGAADSIGLTLELSQVGA